MSSEFSSTVTDSNLNTRGGARTSVMSHVLQVKLEWEQRSQRSKPPMLTELCRVYHEGIVYLAQGFLC